MKQKTPKRNEKDLLIQQLKAEVQKLNSEVSALTSQLNYVKDRTILNDSSDLSLDVLTMDENILIFPLRRKGA